MNSQKSFLTVCTPFPKLQLGYYTERRGIVIVRRYEQVLYIGSSTNIYKAASRLFHKGGALEHININKVVFEVIQTEKKLATIEAALKAELAPLHNHKNKLRKKQSYYQRKQAEQAIDAYYQQSWFDAKGDSKTDTQ